MKKVLILAEHKNGKLKTTSEELLGIAKGHDVAALVIGSSAEEATKTLASKGVKTVYWVKASDFDAYHPEAYKVACLQALETASAEIVLATASALGKDLVARLAAAKDATFAADCTSIELGETIRATRPYFSGKAMGTLEFEPASHYFLSLRANSCAPGVVSEAVGAVSELSVSFDFAGSPLQFVEKTAAKSDKPDLTEANIIISGGRSLKSAENFKILEELAGVFGGAVGASRAAVDEGMASHDMQVGQTGKTVNPSLYVACGISGAIQHLAGMRTSKVIVAINKDPNAPIFTKADYGIVGDLFEVVPELTKEATKLLGAA